MKIQLQYKRIKHILLKHYRNETIFITTTGAIETENIIVNAKIVIDNKKIMFTNGIDKNVIINNDSIIKIKVVSIWHIEIFYRDIKVTIEQ